MKNGTPNGPGGGVLSNKTTEKRTEGWESRMTKVIHAIAKGILKIMRKTKTRRISKCIQAFVMVVEASRGHHKSYFKRKEKPEAKGSQDASKMRPTPV